MGAEPTIIWVALGGALGAMTRFALGEWARVWSKLPGWGAIFVANILGCILLAGGVLWIESLASSGLSLLEPHSDRALFRGLVLVGYCGSLTTFSAFALDTVLLWNEGRRGIAGLNLVASVLLGVGLIELILRSGRGPQ